jgi:alpha/beta superfamily hydrolase
VLFRSIIQQTNNNDKNHLQTLPSSTPNLQQNDNNINTVNEILTKKQFIEIKTKEVRQQFPKYSNKKVNETINNMWKNRQKT